MFFLVPGRLTWRIMRLLLKNYSPSVLAVEYNRCIVLHTDNTAVMHIINNQSAKVPIIMTLVRRLVLACMYHNVLVKAEHIPDKENT